MTAETTRTAPARKQAGVIDLDEVPGTIRSVLARALKSKPEARFQTAEELREALRDVGPDLTPATPEGVLAEGECPSCSTTNDSSRKFCKERECAAPLRVSCLSREEQIPVWDEVCGEWGGKQAELLEERHSSMQEQRDEAEVLGRQLEYTRARELVVQVQSESDPRLQDHQDWATAFLAQLEEEEQKQQLNATAYLSEAETHRTAYDYSSAVKTRYLPVPAERGVGPWFGSGGLNVQCPTGRPRDNADGPVRRRRGRGSDLAVTAPDLNAGAGVRRLGVADQISDGLPKRGHDRPRRLPSHHENGCQAGRGPDGDRVVSPTSGGLTASRFERHSLLTFLLAGCFLDVCRKDTLDFNGQWLWVHSTHVRRGGCIFSLHGR